MAEELKGALRRFRRPAAQPVNLQPTSPFEALLDQRLRQLEEQLQEVKGRVGGLLWAVLAAVVVQVVLGLIRR